MEAPIGLNPKILEEVAKELEKLRKEKKPVNAEQVVQEKLNDELRKIELIMRTLQLNASSELKKTLEQFKRFNERLYRLLYGGR